MAKKYLLYIHNDSAFDKELYKSELVNKLLETHWQTHKVGDYIAPIEDIKEPEMVPIVEERYTTPDNELYRSDKRYDFCKHDAVKGLCKKGC